MHTHVHICARIICAILANASSDDDDYFLLREQQKITKK